MKPWKAELYVVEIWWKHASFAEWLFDSAHTMRKDAEKHKREMNKSGYRHRVVKYRRAKADGRS